MTESTPHLTASRLRSHMRDWPEEKKDAVRSMQGFPAPLVEMRVMRNDVSGGLQGQPAPGREAPRDGKTPGELEIRGPWVASSYYNAPEERDRWTADGWFRTGDVACIDEDGYIKIVDRIKDLIKSGGEWISSVDMENALMGHPAVREAAVIGVPQPEITGAPAGRGRAKRGPASHARRAARIPGKTLRQVAAPRRYRLHRRNPRTSVGKFKKSALRARYANWPTE